MFVQLKYLHPNEANSDEMRRFYRRCPPLTCVCWLDRKATDLFVPDSKIRRSELKSQSLTQPRALLVQRWFHHPHSAAHVSLGGTPPESSGSPSNSTPTELHLNARPLWDTLTFASLHARTAAPINSTKLRASKLAPPISPPSMSFCASSSGAFAGFIEPP
jgi:hypothetical protein